MSSDRLSLFCARLVCDGEIKLVIRPVLERRRGWRRCGRWGVSGGAGGLERCRRFGCGGLSPRGGVRRAGLRRGLGFAFEFGNATVENISLGLENLKLGAWGGKCH